MTDRVKIKELIKHTSIMNDILRESVRPDDRTLVTELISNIHIIQLEILKLLEKNI